ncbi:MAG: hypothetical protein ACLFU2_07630 [Opitutales bacterium]
MNHHCRTRGALHRYGPAAAPATGWLVDPTARRVLSTDWDPASRQFEANGKTFWIGYAGPPEDYPVRSPESLRSFYDQTLETVPAAVLESALREPRTD